MTHKYTNQEKIDFFDTNWEYIDRILNVLQKNKNVRTGQNLLKWLAEFLESWFGND